MPRTSTIAFTLLGLSYIGTLGALSQLHSWIAASSLLAALAFFSALFVAIDRADAKHLRNLTQYRETMTAFLLEESKANRALLAQIDAERAERQPEMSDEHLNVLGSFIVQK